MAKFCRPPLRKGEIVTVAQGLFDGLVPDQAKARKRLFEFEVMNWNEATAFVKKVRPEISVMILEISSDDLHMLVVEERFIAAGPVLDSRYLKYLN